MDYFDRVVNAEKMEDISTQDKIDWAKEIDMHVSRLEFPHDANLLIVKRLGEKFGFRAVPNYKTDNQRIDCVWIQPTPFGDEIYAAIELSFLLEMKYIQLFKKKVCYDIVKMMKVNPRKIIFITYDGDLDKIRRILPKNYGITVMGAKELSDLYEKHLEK